MILVAIALGGVALLVFTRRWEDPKVFQGSNNIASGLSRIIMGQTLQHVERATNSASLSKHLLSLENGKHFL